MIRLGQQFAENYLFGVMLAEMASLFLLFTVPGSLKPLVFTGNSDTPVKAFKRYLSTAARVRTWYSGDLWAADGEARRHLQYVRRVHDRYRRRLNELNSAPAEERAGRLALQVPPWTEGTAAAVRQDFAAQNTIGGGVICPFINVVSPCYEWINQMEMSLTQFAFVGLAVTYPEHFGTSGASEEELEAFVHLWRVLGHLLGVEERFNFCAGGLRAVRERSKAIVRSFVPSSLARADATWEHMTRCILSGVRFYVPQLTYEVVLAQACQLCDVEPPRHLLRQLTPSQRLQRHLWAWVLRWALRVAPLRALANRRLRARLARAQKLADDPEWLRERDSRVGYAAFQRRREKGNMETSSRSISETYLRLVASATTVIVIGALTYHKLTRLSF